jgi:hypothetical protein
VAAGQRAVHRRQKAICEAGDNGSRRKDRTVQTKKHAGAVQAMQSLHRPTWPAGEAKK